MLYAVGVLLVLGHFLAGICTLWNWTRGGRPVTEAHWVATLERLSERGPKPNLVCTPEVETPLSWGLPPGIVLISRDGLARIEDAEAVLAHEIAHIRRRDWLFLTLSRLALALFWFNPLVWRLHKTLAECSEEAPYAQARVHASEARVEAARARAAAHIDHERLAASVRIAQQQARGAQAPARTAQVQAARGMANARVHMRTGAEQMVVGARQMRETSSRLRDPAYGARQIAEARERGGTVTDERRQDLIPELARQADELEARADNLCRESETTPGI